MAYMRARKIFWWMCFGIALSVLAFAIYLPALHFHFWKDDWHFLWDAMNNPGIFLQQRYHPGTSVEFYLLATLFGQHVLAWQYTGIILRTLASLSVAWMTMKITKRVITGLMAGLFYCVTVFGVESVVFASAHVAAIVTFLLCVGMGFWVDYVTRRRKIFLVLALFSFFLGIVFDPWRAFPVIFPMYVTLYVCVTRAKRQILLRRMFIVYTIIFLAAGVVAYISRNELRETQIGKYVLAHQLTLPLVIQKSKMIGHYFNSLTSLFIGWFAPASHEPLEMSHATYQHFRAWLGLFGTIGLGVVIVLLRKKRPKTASIVIFFIAWTLLFYLPGWLYDPRLITTETHRYLTVPSVGFIALMAYMISSLHLRWMQFLLAVVFIVLNIHTSQQALLRISFFRSYTLNEYVWNTISARGAGTSGRHILILRGDDPLKTNVLQYHGAFAYALKRGIGDPNLLPLVTEDADPILAILCQENKERLALNALYSWYLHSDGSLTDTSIKEHEHIRLLAEEKGCVPTESKEE